MRSPRVGDVVRIEGGKAEILRPQHCLGRVCQRAPGCRCACKGCTDSKKIRSPEAL